VSAGTRLAVVSDAVQPFHTGGKEARYAALLPRLAGHGVHVDVYTMKWWPQRRPSVTIGPLTMHAIAPLVPLYTGTRRSIRQAVVFALSSLRMLRRDFDVLEADAIPFVQLYPLWAVARLRRRPFLVTWHEVWGRDYWRSYLGPAGVLAAWLEDAILATSEQTAERVRALRGGAGGDVTVVPPGVDRAAIAALQPATGVADIVCLGRLLAHKNVDLVIAALAALRGQGRDLRLAVIGQGPELGRLRQQAAALGVADAVEFREPVADHHDVLALLAGAGVLAFPSVREGFGMVALEALACGVPVVTADHPDNYARRLVTDGVTGRVCEPTAAALAAALADVLDRRGEYAAKAAESVADHDWDQLAARVAEVVRQLPDPNRSSRGTRS
jgi:glycosyltransferase involved in cell wall biosynthesis